MFWPARFTFIYPRWNVNAGEWWQWLYPVATVATLAGAWIARDRMGKGLFAALMHFYVSTSLLVLFVVLFMMRYSFVADHWAYFGSLSIAALIGAGLTRAADHIPLARKLPLEWAAGLALILLLGTLTRAESRTYINIETLWRATIANNPACWMARTNLGRILLHEGHTGEAVAQSREALRINPADEHAYINLGNALREQGHLDEGIAQYREALRVDPNYADAHVDIGNTLLEENHPDEAAAEYLQALRINPNYAQVHFNLAILFTRQGRLDNAVSEYREALRIDPDLAEAHANLGNLLLQLGRTAEAIAEYREAVRIAPNAPLASQMRQTIMSYGAGR
jgi:tetratricopeptide (TPR) repeat protein